MLYRGEVDKFLFNSALDPLLGYFTKEELIKRMSNYMEGNFDNAHKEFIDARQFFWKDCREKLWQSDNGKIKKELHFKNYVDYCFDFMKRNITIFQEWIYGLIKKELSPNDTSRLLINLNSFPALHTALMAQFFKNYLIAKNGATPSEDKFTDSLQIIGASYSSVIVSDDKYLINTLVNSLNPKIEAIAVRSLKKRIQ